MRTETPKATHLKDYRPTPYLIQKVSLTFRLHGAETRVRAELKMKPNPASKKRKAALELDGEKIRLLSVFINGKALAADDYATSEKQLVIVNPPQKPFTLVLETQCDPTTNTELSGLYVSSGIYCTQCEAQGFRRITYFYDRPDVLAPYHVRVEAPQSLPVLLSNGNPQGVGQD